MSNLQVDLETINRRMLQSFDREQFGTPIIAEIGGSFSQFRLSDDVDFVNRVLTESPQSFIKDYPDQVNELRERLGLKPMNTDELQNVPDASDTMPVYENAGFLDETAKKYLPPLKLAEYLPENAFLKLGLYATGAILLAIGVFLAAYSVPAIREATNTVAKDAAKAAAA